MKLPGLLLLFLCVGGAIFANDVKPVRVFLSPKSNITTSEVAEGLSKYCQNVVLTQDVDKADYVLEAASTFGVSDGTSYRQWHFALLNRDGDVVMTTHPERSIMGTLKFGFGNRYKHHFESVCKFIKTNQK